MKLSIERGIIILDRRIFSNASGNARQQATAVIAMAGIIVRGPQDIQPNGEYHFDSKKACPIGTHIMRIGEIPLRRKGLPDWDIASIGTAIVISVAKNQITNVPPLGLKNSEPNTRAGSANPGVLNSGFR
jgi:hypothetical protein